ncbi:histidine kinase [Streptomyces sp. DSM 42041]|uniref:Histidine kinase n=1 Tax=Streptomyces hazeniae TaxID=3075538 RepID=A0ABU2NLB4_9ACTN|nr:histidine kinase [Streptomyces sp. DSM 42041]MDT0377554.1 histidine kinase [Streptomyces sp. DSM 42041]
MYGWAQERHRQWHDRSRHAQVEASTRWMLGAMPWLVFLAGGPQLLALAGRSPLAASLAWGVLVLGLAQCTLATRLTGPALDVYLGLGSLAGMRLFPLLVVLAVSAILATGPVTVAETGDGVLHGLVFLSMSAPVLCVLALVVRMRTYLLLHAGFVAFTMASAAAGGRAWSDLATTTAVALAVAPALLFTQRSTGWYVAVLRELAAAREVQTRLAVAEERLRFARDLHDVLGRNLAVIALKSELAAELARRGVEDKATRQLDEVQHLARDSQREVRDVVRAYRRADLSAELAGARRVLSAAGVKCRVATDDVPDVESLTEPVQSALGWVVREGTTNVLRHAHGSAVCTVSLRITGHEAVLVLENDTGSRTDAVGDGGDGTGLTGLRERLAALGGTLAVQRPTRSTFRVTARVPVTTALPSPSPDPGLHPSRA